MGRRVLRCGMWAALGASVLIGGALALGLARPTWRGSGGLVVGVTSGRLEIARSDGALARQGNAWAVSCPQGMASILVGPESWWRPTSGAGRVGLGMPTATLTLRVDYVPLWPWLALSVLASGLLWWRAGRRVLPGHCRECGYDLRGLSGDKCPECGGLVRMLRAAAAWLLGAGPVEGMG